LVKSGIDAHLVMVGIGPLEGDVRAQVAALGLTERCTFAGGHNDVTSFYAALDLLVFPSLWEGFGLVTLEAQAAGVPVLASHAVPAEASVIPALMHYRSLEEGPAQWARMAQRILSCSSQRDRRWSAGLMARTRFSIDRSVRELRQVYHSARAGEAALPAGTIAR
jgi:glycosyltransferase involved in cell wall biosynthesis